MMRFYDTIFKEIYLSRNKESEYKVTAYVPQTHQSIQHLIGEEPAPIDYILIGDLSILDGRGDWAFPLEHHGKKYLIAPKDYVMSIPELVFSEGSEATPSVLGIPIIEDNDLMRDVVRHWKAISHVKRDASLGIAGYGAA